MDNPFYQPKTYLPEKRLWFVLSRVPDMVAMVRLGSPKYPCSPEDAAERWEADEWDNAVLIRAAELAMRAGYHPALMQRFIAVWRAR